MELGEYDDINEAVRVAQMLVRTTRKARIIIWCNGHYEIDFKSRAHEYAGFEIAETVEV